MKRSILCVLAATSALALSGCGGAADTPAAETSTETVTVQETTVAPATSEPVAPSPASVMPTVSAVVAAPVPMPAVVCMNLQEAQDLIQSAGVFFSRSEDATGADRAQVLDRNWSVVAQTPQPGELVTEAEAVLSVVKIGEPGDCS